MANIGPWEEWYAMKKEERRKDREFWDKYFENIDKMEADRLKYTNTSKKYVKNKKN